MKTKLLRRIRYGYRLYKDLKLNQFVLKEYDYDSISSPWIILKVGTLKECLEVFHENMRQNIHVLR